MNPELTYTLELARVFKSCIEQANTSQERVGFDLAFDRALKRGDEAIISMLQKAVRDLAPSDGADVAKFIRTLEYGELPALIEARITRIKKTASKKTSHRTAGTAPISEIGVIRGSEFPVPLPSDAKSAEIMSQWRVTD